MYEKVKEDLSKYENSIEELSKYENSIEERIQSFVENAHKYNGKLEKMFQLQEFGIYLFIEVFIIC